MERLPIIPANLLDFETLLAFYREEIIQLFGLPVIKAYEEEDK